MLSRLRKWLVHYPKTAYVIYACFVVIVFLAGWEILLRMTLRYNPSYYVSYAKPRPGLVLEYPYGTMRFNSDGYPDDEFEPVKNRPRVAYIGDSNCYGVGAGYGYRITELLEESFPELEHMNLSRGIGAKGVTKNDTYKTLREVDRYDLDMVVYIMSLNDVLPDSATTPQTQPTAKGEGRYKQNEWFQLRHKFDWLRGRSYLYTYLRTLLKNYYSAKGYNMIGHKAYEFYPDEYAEAFEATARRIDNLAAELNEKGVQFVALILPYEMQISSEAEEIYPKLGAQWAPEFIDRGAQKKLLHDLQVARAVDLYPAFVGVDPPQRNLCGIGECFVFDKGDKLDWHHPTRKGHQMVADFITHREADEPLFSLLSAAGRDLLERGSGASLPTEQ